MPLEEIVNPLREVPKGETMRGKESTLGPFLTNTNENHQTDSGNTEEKEESSDHWVGWCLTLVEHFAGE